ncbi:MAG TPA: DUF72 domain-containing protein [Aliidongia sp.]|uniref:DUF72 domain-containing protein n=1 Tax=Aliidongia sp. TaxID=1914230 RepID=UPI002DDD168A|nr:DUF72 domain-containing protein [Aliidongia sp.]HEV2674288.1 DUF72 domain-containing protein [Aliidongia sp.]
MTKRGDIRIGISGWRYAPWRGVFYPKGLRQKDELAYASRHFRSIEINGTFYGPQRPSVFTRWVAETPDDFVFAVKGPRYITHIRRLREPKEPLANFLASGVLNLGAKLGPILWQFPPSFRYDRAVMEPFLALLPHDTVAAGKLAAKHDDRMKEVVLTPDAKHPMRHAIEIRHDSFADPDFIDLLRIHRVALVCADTVEWPRLMDLAADFVYCRLHGSEQLYASGYGDAALDRWAGWIEAWARGGEAAGKDTRRVIDEAGPARATRDVFVYFDNDIKVRAPFDADGLAKRLHAEAADAAAAD